MCIILRKHQINDTAIVSHGIIVSLNLPGPGTHIGQIGREYRFSRKLIVGPELQAAYRLGEFGRPSGFGAESIFLSIDQ